MLLLHDTGLAPAVYQAHAARCNAAGLKKRERGARVSRGRGALPGCE